MLKLAMYQVDAFTSELFHGNPAAVVPLDAWLPDATLQAIAAENNVSETAFIVRPTSVGQIASIGASAHAPAHWGLRWFTPACEVVLCGHATLAAAWVITHKLVPHLREVAFDTASGVLRVTRGLEFLTMDFPADPPVPALIPDALVDALGVHIVEYWTGSTMNLARLENRAAVEAALPVGTLDCLEERNLIITAEDADYDFVSRMFGPFAGIAEDPVTGSAHCLLAPFWAARLGKHSLNAWQASRRGGAVLCELIGERVRLSGTCVEFLSGQISVPKP